MGLEQGGSAQGGACGSVSGPAGAEALGTQGKGKVGVGAGGPVGQAEAGPGAGAGAGGGIGAVTPCVMKCRTTCRNWGEPRESWNAGFGVQGFRGLGFQGPGRPGRWVSVSRVLGFQCLGF